MSGHDPDDDVIFTVSMLAELRPAFVAWLGENDLHMARLPDSPGDEYIVVPTPGLGEDPESLWYGALTAKIQRPE